MEKMLQMMARGGQGIISLSSDQLLQEWLWPEQSWVIEKKNKATLISLWDPTPKRKMRRQHGTQKTLLMFLLEDNIKGNLIIAAPGPALDRLRHPSSCPPPISQLDSNFLRKAQVSSMKRTCWWDEQVKPQKKLVFLQARTWVSVEEVVFYLFCFLAADHELDREFQGYFLFSPAGWRVKLRRNTGEPFLSPHGAVWLQHPSPHWLSRPSGWHGWSKCPPPWKHLFLIPPASRKRVAFSEKRAR